MALLRVAALAALSCFALLAQAPNQIVIFKTSMGDIEMTLYPSFAPATVANFLNYVNKLAYDNSFIHRTVRSQGLTIIQGGGYTWDGTKPVEIAPDAPVKNEFALSNTRGTIAMALADDPNGATNQWFINTADNSASLNPQGFTVFGRVTTQTGLAVMDKLQAVRAPNPAPFASPFDSMPLVNYSGGDVTEDNLLVIKSIRLLERPPQPAIRTDTGVILASAFGGAAVAAPGAFIEVYGDNLAGGEVVRGWATSDFINNRAPTVLEGASVTINGQPTFMSYVSPTQLNVQIPANVPTGEPLAVVVSYRGVASDPVRLKVLDQAGGLLAPSSFKVGDKQYVVALRPATGAFISNGTIPGVAATPAERGETIVFYGTGFGLITGSTTSLGGEIAQGTSRVVAPVQFKFGGATGQVTYAGLTPGLVGLYQFNVVVPADAPGGDVELQVIQAGTPIAQKLFIPVRP